MVGSTPHLLPGMPVWVRNQADPSQNIPISWSRAVLVKPEPGAVVSSWAARLADDPLHRRNVSVRIEDLLSRSEDEDEAMSGNLTALREVSEPEVMSALLRRFNVDQVFTYAGPVLVSVKPNRPLPLYDLEHQRQFHFAVMNESRAASPHLYAIGGRAYRAMVKDQLSQTVLFSGASGSGKSFAARMVLRQLVECSTLRGDDADPGRPFDSASILVKLEAATELIRLMGCVTQADSPDCNRYLMVTEGQFDAQPALVGVSLMAQLLDKSPLTTGHQGHNFHMLHLLADYGAANFKFLHIDPGTQFRYLAGCKPGQINPVTATLSEAGKNGPLRNWDLVVKSLDLLEVSRNETSFFLQLLAAVLHLGNLEFVNEGVVEGRNVTDSHMTRAMPSDLGLFKLICQLLWLEEELVLECIVGKHPDQVNLSKPGEVFKGRLPTASQAQANCDLLAQTVYQVAFEFIVGAANEKLACVDSGLISYHMNFVDTPGLTNDSSFGSLCCNLMCEMIQDRIWRTFLAGPCSKLQAEGIQNSIQVTNARNVLSVLDQGVSGPGVLPILSEIHSMTKDTLKLLLSKMVQGGEPSSSVITDVQLDSFRISHTGHSIQYDSEMILAACGGLFGLDVSVVLQQSGNRILRGGAAMLDSSSNAYLSFKASADAILNSINPYSTHVVQTVKPSCQGDQSADKSLVASQVDASVLLPLLEWEKNGFTEWIPHGQFVREYRYLLSEDDLANMLLKDLCRKVLSATLPPDAYAIGSRHILLKGDKTRALAAHLEARRDAAAVAIQARCRGVIGRIRFRRLWRIKNTAANNIKRVLRGMQQRQEHASMREQTVEAQKLLSRVVKGHLSRLATINHKPNQYFGKGYNAWNKGLSMWEKAYHAALTFKRMYRGHATRKWYWGYTERDGTEMIGFREWKLEAIVTLQRYYRGYLGRRRANALATRVYAACVIQECYIKHLVRRNAYMTRIQRWWRAIMAERAFGWVHMKLTDAAMKVQRVFRGHKGRDLAAKCHGVQACADLWFGATRIQRWIRPMLARIREARRHRMATKIQRCWRSAVARAAWLWVHCQLNDSATQITKSFRGWRSRKKTLALKASLQGESYLDGGPANKPRNQFALGGPGTGPNTARSGVSDYGDYESGADTDRSAGPGARGQPGGLAGGARPRKPKFSLTQPCAPNLNESKLIERRKAGAEPFTPAINEKSATLKRTGRVEDRLEQAHRSHLERMEAQRRAKLEADLAQNSGAPKMNRNSKRLTKSLGKIEDRFPKYQRQARINLEKAREEQGKHEEETLTFHPKITKPAQAMERTPEVWEQWYKDKYKRLKDLERAVRAQEDQDIRGPQLSIGTARIAAKRKDGDKKVYDRLYAYQGKYRENRENLIREEEQRFSAEQAQATQSRARPSYRPKKELVEEDAPRGSELFSSMGLHASGMQHSYTPTVNPRSTEIMRKKQQQALQMLEGGEGTQVSSRLVDSVTGKGHSRSLDQWNTMLNSFKEDFDR